jgi:hypothetical protein
MALRQYRASAEKIISLAADNSENRLPRTGTDDS